MLRTGLLLAVFVLASAHAPAAQPNVVLFVVDDMGWVDCGAYGSEFYETPHIDQLARRGVRFTNAYAASPLCSPTRASLLTGKYPARLGLTTAAGHQPPKPADAPRYPENAPPNREVLLPESLRYLDPAEYTLAEALRDAGYRTGHFGKWHLGLTEPYWPERQGYEVAFHGKPDPGPPSPNGYFSPYSFKAGTVTPGPDGEYIVDRVASEVIDFIDARGDRPFFAAVWQYGVHGPWDHKEEITRRFAGKRDPRGKQQNAVMASMLASIDDSVGRIVTALEERGLADHTIFLFTSDNGGNVHSNTRTDRRKANVKPGHPLWRSLSSYRKYAGFQPPTNNDPLRDGKGTLYEGGVRVPFIAVWPGHFPAGRVADELVSTIDFYPTLLELLDVEPAEPQQFDGISVATVLRDPEQELPRDELFFYFPHGGPTKPPGVTVRRGKWKLIRWYQTSAAFPSRHELYDLEADLGETNNVASEHPDLVAELDAAIDRFLDETNTLVPKPNPAYDPKAAQADPLQGWVAKGSEAKLVGDALVLTKSGRPFFLATAQLREAGPVVVRARVRSDVAGELVLQWRGTNQETFPPSGQRVRATLPADEWTDVRFEVPVAGSLQHLRLWAPEGSEQIEIDWVDVGRPATGLVPRRWDFAAE